MNFAKHFYHGSLWKCFLSKQMQLKTIHMFCLSLVIMIIYINSKKMHEKEQEASIQNLQPCQKPVSLQIILSHNYIYIYILMVMTIYKNLCGRSDIQGCQNRLLYILSCKLIFLHATYLLQNRSSTLIKMSRINMFLKSNWYQLSYHG